MAGSRTLFCLGAFSCTFLLTAIVLYASNYDVEKNLEEVVSWIKRNKTPKNNSDIEGIENVNAPVPNALIEQEVPLEDQNIMIVQPRIVRCQCFLCKIPLEPLLMETDMTHEPPSQQYEPILKRLQRMTSEEEPLTPDRLFLDPLQWAAMLKRSSQPKLQVVDRAVPETDDFEMNIDDFEITNPPEFREIFYEMLDNSGNRKSIMMRQYFGIKEKSGENINRNGDSKSYENNDDSFSFEIPAPYVDSAEQVTEQYFAAPATEPQVTQDSKKIENGHTEMITESHTKPDDSSKKITHSHTEKATESHDTTQQDDNKLENEITHDHSKKNDSQINLGAPLDFIKHHTNPIETFENDNLNDEPSIEEKKETMRRKRHRIHH